MNILDEFDTIAAVATPHGTGGVGVIRISGDKAFDIIKKIFTNPHFEPRKFNHGWIVEPSDNPSKEDKKIDEVIVLPFFSPNSYTGEDVIEIQCHGGINVVKNILNLVLASGARMAERGEFTKRAFLNKKMDLSQAEAVADLIHSKTSEFAKVSLKNLSGVLKEKINGIKKDILEVLSKITAAIDFPEDVKEPDYEYLIQSFERIISSIKEVLRGADTSNIFRQGISVAIVGKPNVGKSSLFNALLNTDRAIVTDIAGTTRDIIRETLDLGIPVTLVDTAGIRNESEDKIEQIGIEYSKQSLDEADLVLFVYDVNQELTKEDKEILALLKNKKHLIIANKTDLLADKDFKPAIPPELKDEKIIYISAIENNKNNGIDSLKEELTSAVCDTDPESLDFVTNTRQQECLRKAEKSLEQALLAAQTGVLQDMISIDVKSALLALDELTGELITDEVLNNIFDNFCIGK